MPKLTVLPANIADGDTLALLFLLRLSHTLAADQRTPCKHLR